MNERRWLWLLLVVGLGAAGCERTGESEVSEEVKDLKEAQQESPAEAQNLRKQLEEKKSEVVKLEEKLALAEQGVTDRVVEERKDLEQAVRRQEQNVQQEVKEAQGAARVHNTDSERARRELEATQSPTRVEAQVNTERKVVPNDTTVEVQKQRQEIPIDTSRTVERQATTTEQPAAPQNAPAAPAR